MANFIRKKSGNYKTDTLPKMELSPEKHIETEVTVKKVAPVEKEQVKPVHRKTRAKTVIKSENNNAPLEENNNKVTPEADE